MWRPEVNLRCHFLGAVHLIALMQRLSSCEPKTEVRTAKGLLNKEMSVCIYNYI